jgi:integrase
MDDGADLQPWTRAMLAGSVLEPYVRNYRTRLLEQRYAASTQRVYLCCVSHFACWLKATRIGLDGVNEEAGERFVAGHLPQCNCRPPVRRVPYEIKAALSHLYEVLRDSRVVAAPSGSAGHIQAELVSFDHYMDATCGLAGSTRRQRVQILARFLTARFGSDPIAVTAITAAEMRQFVLGGRAAYSAGTVNVMAGALRCYLRFRALAGDPVGKLGAAIPTPAHWRLATLPDVLSDAEIEELLASFDGTLPSPRRAYAIVRCLVDLGLRSSEVIHLRLDDIDWHAGTLRLAKEKSRRADVLPLPAATGRAIADYLRSERPPTANRAVFARHVAPYDEPLGTCVVQRVVNEAYRRCGWTRTGVHILRHSVASRLLRKGTPLKEIADILRHQSLDTSAIYVKVDTGRLSAVALPWPGRAS